MISDVQAAGRALAVLLLAAALPACTADADRPPVALAASAPPVNLAQAGTTPAVKTVRPSPAAMADEGGDGDMPTPKQIFDFHPAGSHPDAWREPFVIDPNDGPLARDVRRSAAELKAFLAMPKTPANKTPPNKTSAIETTAKAEPRQAGRRPCSETDVATARAGCPAAGAVPGPH